jgi:hypothetical protein
LRIISGQKSDVNARGERKVKKIVLVGRKRKEDETRRDKKSRTAWKQSGFCCD